MRPRLTGWALLWLGVAVASLPGQARADYLTTPWQTVTITDPYNPTLGLHTDWNSGQQVYVQNGNTPVQITVPTLSVTKFDPNANPYLGQPGKLIGVEVSIDYSFQNTIKLEFNTVSTMRVDVTAKMQLSLPNGGNTTLSFPGTNVVANPQPNSGSFLNSSGNVVCLSPNDILQKYRTFGPTTVSGNFNQVVNNAGELAKFTGTGTIDLPVLAQANSNFFSSSGNGFGSSETYARAVVSIRYLYVPEPASVLLTGLGGLGLVIGWGRQSRRQAAA